MNASLHRQGLVGGSAKSGGMGVSILSSTYRETGTQNIAAGISIQAVEQRPGGLTGTLGAGARFAQQVGASGDWRAYTRTSFGLGACQLRSCTPTREQDRYAFDAQLGVERFVMRPDSTNPQDNAGISAEFSVMYTRTVDSMLGDGHFIGLGIGLRLGINYFRDTPAGDAQ